MNCLIVLNLTFSIIVTLAIDRVHTGVGKLWKLMIPFSMTWKVLEKRSFQNGCGTFWILLGKVIKCPEMDISKCRIERHIP